jgi:hypothetical protein
VVEIGLTRHQVVRIIFPNYEHRVTITDASFDGQNVNYVINYDEEPRSFKWDIPGTMSGLNVTAGTLKSVSLDGDHVRYRFE